jgi:phosphate transport system protein
MSKSYQQNLDAADGMVRKMAALVQDAIRGGVKSLRERDGEAAETVLAGDDAIDALENAVLEECCRLLARHQPMGGNLRRVISILQVASELERMGDLAGALVGRAVRMLDFPAFPVPARLGAMADRVIEMVHLGLDAFLTEDSGLAREVRDRDDEVDEDNAAIIGDLIERMKQGPEFVEPGLSLFSAVRHLERIADHATNVTEHAVFLVEGELLRHQHLQLEASVATLASGQTIDRLCRIADCE